MDRVLDVILSIIAFLTAYAMGFTKANLLNFLGFAAVSVIIITFLEWYSKPGKHSPRRKDPVTDDTETTSSTEGKRPSPPNDVQVTDVTETTITLHLSESEHGGGSPITGYIFELSESWTDKYRKVDVKWKNKTHCMVENLKDGTLYHIRVAAQNETGISDYVTKGFETKQSHAGELAQIHTALSKDDIERYIKLERNLETTNEEVKQTKDEILKKYTLTNGPTLNLVLLGKTGAGKSSTGNLILGVKRFMQSYHSQSCTLSLEKGECIYGSIKIHVIDTPNPDDKEAGKRETFRDISQAEKELGDRIDALLFVFNIGNPRFNDQQEIFTALENGYFGKDAKNSSFAILTNIDTKKDIESLPKYLEIEQQTPFGILLNKTFNGRVIAVNSADQTVYGREVQRQNIIELILAKREKRISTIKRPWGISNVIRTFWEPAVWTGVWHRLGW